MDHDCGAGRTLTVEHKGQGFHAYCFRCSDSGFIPHPTPSLSERLAALARVREVEVQATSSLALPEPQEYDPQAWPMKPRVWLYKAGFSNDDITRLGWYYCPPLGRVVMPIYEEGRLVYWQARGFMPGQAKYINPTVDRSALAARYGTGPVLVLTEDVLSAYRVARVTEAWSLLGTKLLDGVAVQVAGARRPVILALDPDKGGRDGEVRVRSVLNSLGVPSYTARFPKDPKYSTREETILCLNSALPTALRLPWPQ